MRVFEQMDETGTGALPVRRLVEFVQQLTGCTEEQASQFLATVDANH